MTSDSSSSESEDSSDSDSESGSDSGRQAASGEEAATGAVKAGDGSYSNSASSYSSHSASDESESDTARNVNEDEPSNPNLVVARVFDGPPPPAENLTYKLKIMLSFLQIATNLSSGLDIQWPTLYKSFLLNFDIINFTSILGNVTSSECIGAVTYYRELVVMMLAPLIAFAACVVLYLLPSHFDLLCFRHQTLQSKTRTRMKFWKLFLYTLFLIYPSLSSTVLREFVCISIDSTDWLLTNLRVQCYTSDWYFYSYVALPFIVLYPIGIPLFFFVLLHSNRRHLHERRVQAQLGFLYASYQRQLWWWEILDSVNKLFLTSVLAFFPSDSQLPLAMGCISLYSMCVLVMQPFLSPSDDLLQLLALTELFMLCLAGWIYFNTTDATLDSTQDTFVSVCLIAITILFFVGFMLAILWAARKLALHALRKWQSSRVGLKDMDADAKQQAQKEEQTQLPHANTKLTFDPTAVVGVYSKQASGYEEQQRDAKQRPALLPLSDLSSHSAVRSKPASVRNATARTPSASNRVAPAVMPPASLVASLQPPQSDGNASKSDSESGCESYNESGSGGHDEHKDDQSAATRSQHGEATSRAVSRVQSSVGRPNSAGRDAWSAPSTPRLQQQQPVTPPKLTARSLTLVRQSSRIASSPSVAQVPMLGSSIAEAEEDKDDSDSDGDSDERKKQQTQQQSHSQPQRTSTLTSSASLRPATAAKIAHTPSPLLSGASPSLPSGRGVRGSVTAAALTKKKRRVIKAGDNFSRAGGGTGGALAGGSRPASGATVNNSPLPSLKSLAAALRQ